MNSRVGRCQFNSTELKDIRYIDSYIYNRLEYLRFDSSVGRFVGFTELGVENAEKLNKGSELTRMKAQREAVCLPYAGLWFNYFLTKSGELVF